jgi:hypothetical protein
LSDNINTPTFSAMDPYGFQIQHYQSASPPSPLPQHQNEQMSTITALLDQGRDLTNLRFKILSILYYVIDVVLKVSLQVPTIFTIVLKIVRIL